MIYYVFVHDIVLYKYSKQLIQLSKKIEKKIFESKNYD